MLARVPNASMRDEAIGIVDLSRSDAKDPERETKALVVAAPNAFW
jgi:hypothetical protein